MNQIIKKTKFTINDLREALDYYEEYNKEFPEEKGEYPNWENLIIILVIKSGIKL